VCTGKPSHLDKGVGARHHHNTLKSLSDLPATVVPGWRRVSITATTREAIYGLARDGGRHTLASIRAWTEEASVAATPCGAASVGHAYDGGTDTSALLITVIPR
jgi:hypothetical protein